MSSTHDLNQLQAIADALPPEDKRELAQFLLSRLQSENVDTNDVRAPGHSVLDIKPVSLGGAISTFGVDDLLGEMLEGRR